MEENKVEENKFEEMQETMKKITEAMEMTHKKQEDIDKKTKKLKRETKIMGYEEGKEEIEELKQSKKEFDEMTVSALVNMKKDILTETKSLEEENVKKVLEFHERGKQIEATKERMLARADTEEKKENVENGANKALQKLDLDQKEWQSTYDKRKTSIGKWESQITEYALELDALEKLDEVRLEDEKEKQSEKDEEQAQDSTEPGQAEPEPTKPEPTEPEPTEPEPTKPEPTKPEPTKPEPTKPEPTKPEPTKPEPTKPEPTKPEPTKPEPTKPEPTKPEPTKPEPTKPEPTKPEPTKGKLNVTKVVINKDGVEYEMNGEKAMISFKDIEGLNITAILDKISEINDGKPISIAGKSREEMISTWLTNNEDGEISEEYKKEMRDIITYDRSGIDYTKFTKEPPFITLFSKISRRDWYSKIRRVADEAEREGTAEIVADKPGPIRRFFQNLGKGRLEAKKEPKTLESGDGKFKDPSSRTDDEQALHEAMYAYEDWKKQKAQKEASKYEEFKKGLDPKSEAYTQTPEIKTPEELSAQHQAELGQLLDDYSKSIDLPEEKQPNQDDEGR